MLHHLSTQLLLDFQELKARSNQQTTTEPHRPNATQPDDDSDHADYREPFDGRA